MKTTFLITLLVVPSLVLNAQRQKEKVGSWVLAYANDERGNKIGGDLGTLITAIRNGEPVRINWTIQHSTMRNIKVEHSTDAKFITILSDSVVFAQIDPIVGQTPNVKDRSITLKENVQWSFSASTLGNNDSMNTNIKTGEILDHQIFACGIRWFIRK